MSRKPTKRIKMRDRFDIEPIGVRWGNDESKDERVVIPDDIKPYTLKECFHILDRALSDQDKEYLLDTSREDVEIHLFDIRLFILNKFIYNNEVLVKNLTEKLIEAYGKVHEDDVSGYIVSRYRRYLRVVE